MNDLISIIVPMYNAEKYIEGCINSLINQTYQKIEIIVVDDGSTDSSKNIVSKMSKNDARIKLFSQVNSGPSEARNTGIKKSQGKWMMFVDSDDTLISSAVQDLIKNNISVDLVVAGWTGIYEEYEEYYGSKQTSTIEGKEIDMLIEYLVSNGVINKKNIFCTPAIEGPVAKLYSSTIIKDNNILFPTDIKYAEDVCFNFNYIQNCKKIKILNKSIYKASRHNDSLSNSFKSLIIHATEVKKYLIINNIGDINIDDSFNYRYFNWLMYDLENLCKESYTTFKTYAKKYGVTNLPSYEHYGTIKKLELFLLKHNIFILFLLLKIFMIIRKR